MPAQRPVVVAVIEDKATALEAEFPAEPPSPLAEA
jgi:hypothetical protein